MGENTCCIACCLEHILMEEHLGKKKGLSTNLDEVLRSHWMIFQIAEIWGGLLICFILQNRGNNIMTLMVIYLSYHA